MKNYPVGANYSMRTDARTDRQKIKLRVASRNVANYSKRVRNNKVNLNFLIDIFVRMFSCRTWKYGIFLLNSGKKEDRMKASSA